MNTISNLIKRHLTSNVLNSNLWILLFGFAFWFLMPKNGTFATLIVFFGLCIFSLISLENTNANNSLVNLPAKRSQIIKSLYASTLIILGLISCMSLLSVFIGYGFDNSFGQLLIIVNLCLPLLIFSILIPLGIKLGQTSFQVLSIGLLILISIHSQIAIARSFQEPVPLEFSANVLFYIPISLIVSLIIFTLSMKLSIKLFEKKEFN
ncbi:MAG: ABC-2 transporter permease [Sarcina sp.]